MIRDAVVDDVRRAGEELAKQANYDLHTFFQNLNKSKDRYKDRLVTHIPKPTADSTATSNR